MQAFVQTSRGVINAIWTQLTEPHHYSSFAKPKQFVISLKNKKITAKRCFDFIRLEQQQIKKEKEKEGEIKNICIDAYQTSSDEFEELLTLPAGWTSF